MLHTVNLFKASAEDAQRRETESKEYVQKAISEAHDRFQESLQVRDRESQVMARDQIALTAQVSHLTETVAQLRETISANADFAVDAIQQVRDEAAGEAANAGGTKGPDVHTNASHSNAIIGKPPSSTNTPGPYSVTCTYCDGEVPKVIAKQCQDCNAYFHPSHYAAHREEWPCPKSTENWCMWCNEYIQEHHAKANCASCFCDMHTECFSAHLPCPDGWVARAPLPDAVQGDREQSEHVEKQTTSPDVHSMVARIEALEATAKP